MNSEAFGNLRCYMRFQLFLKNSRGVCNVAIKGAIWRLLGCYFQKTTPPVVPLGTPTVHRRCRGAPSNKGAIITKYGTHHG